jgi:hypothetical protein
MKKWISRAILLVLGLLAILFFAFPYLMSWQLSDSHGKTWEAMNQTDLKCPSGTEVTSRGWSKAGYTRYCEPKKNGPWEAWSGGYRQIQGEYRNGLEHGRWIWFNEDGTIQSTIVYENGEPVQ